MRPPLESAPEVLLSDLATLPGEDRAARLQEAVHDMVKAWPVLAGQAEHLARIAQFTLVNLVIAMGPADFTAAWHSLTDQPIPRLPVELLLSAFAQQAGLVSQEAFAARLQNDPDFKQQLDELMAFVGVAPTLPDGDQATIEALANQLITWIQTPDWAQSQAYLQEHAAALLTDEAEAALTLLQQSNPGNQLIPQHAALLQRAREIGIEAAYQELQAALAAAQDPTAQAIAALFRVNSAEALQAALDKHPALLELTTLSQLASLVTGTQKASQTEAARHSLALVAILLEQYNHAHTEQIDPEEQAQFVALHETLIPLAAGLDGDLAVGLRRSLGWALNTLGNHYAGQADHEKAIETYAQALAQAPDDAMLYRNRAGQYIELGQLVEAQADVERATQLEPDAPRLAQLRQALATADGQD